MKYNPERTTRIALRCTRTEHNAITELASKYKLSVTDFIRQAVVIATARAPTVENWRTVHAESMNHLSFDIPWNTN